jgi:endonuclease III
MKNARHYQRKIKKLLRGARPAVAGEVPPGLPRVQLMIEAILQADGTRRQAAEAMGPLQDEYVDLNELRVSPVKDITDCLGRAMPAAREKAERIVTVLNRVFARTNDTLLDWLVERPKRELRRTLTELGLGPYAGAAVAMLLFGLPAVPVDQTLVDCLKADGYVHPDSDVIQVQSFLEKVVPMRNALGAHEALRRYCEKRAKTLPKKPVVAAPPPEPVVEAKFAPAVPPPVAPPPVRPPLKAPARPIKAPVPAKAAARPAKAPPPRPARPAKARVTPKAKTKPRRRR